MSRYEKGVLSLILSLMLTLSAAVCLATAAPNDPVSSEANTSTAQSSSQAEGSSVSSVPQESEPEESEPEESEPEESSKASSAAAPKSSSRASSKSSSKAASSKRAASSRSNNGGGGGTVSKKPEPSVSYQAGGTSGSAGGATKPSAKNIDRLDMEALKWLFVPILGILLSAYILISENYRAVKAKRAGRPAARRPSVAGGARANYRPGSRPGTRRDEDGNWML